FSFVAERCRKATVRVKERCNQVTLRVQWVPIGGTGVGDLARMAGSAGRCAQRLRCTESRPASPPPPRRAPGHVFHAPFAPGRAYSAAPAGRGPTGPLPPGAERP